MADVLRLIHCEDCTDSEDTWEPFAAIKRLGRRAMIFPWTILGKQLPKAKRSMAGRLILLL